ncbi:hypothetical protein NUH30_00160 [Leptospira sp. 85282-16]|nr:MULTISPECIES: hypothetical protein [Leptospira]MCT8332072.1 hypothetical protein [Leptospira sp. 85282-16]
MSNNYSGDSGATWTPNTLVDGYRAVLVGKRLFFYGTSNYGSQNVYTDLE